MSWESAAGLTACSLTSYRTIYKYYNDFHPRKRVLITGTYSLWCGIHSYSYCLSGRSTSIGRMAIWWICSCKLLQRQWSWSTRTHARRNTFLTSSSYVHSSLIIPYLQIINYDTSPLHLQLAAQYTSTPFDLINSTSNDPYIFPSSPSYLKPKGKFIQPGGSFDDGILKFT